MMFQRGLAVVTLALGMALTSTATASAGSEWSGCRIWHGEQYCREQAAAEHIPSGGQLRGKPRDCRTSWGDWRTDCGSQA